MLFRSGLDIGMDIGSPVDFTYRLPFTFNGKIQDVVIELGPTDIGKQGTSGPVAQTKAASA